MQIAIIGAGPAGLAAAKHCLEDGQRCTVFEQGDKIGGTWNYVEETDLDQFGLSVHSSMYKGLKTNLPKELMEFKNFPYKNIHESYIEQPQVLAYIHEFAEEFQLNIHIQFCKQVVEVDPHETNRWKITIFDVKRQIVEENKFFDAVLICNGHYTVPRMPENLQGLEDFQGTKIHSHTFRRAEKYGGRKVVVFGSGPSAVDICRILLPVASQVFISHYSLEPKKMSVDVVQKPWVEQFYRNSVQFLDGTVEEVDDIIFCTGYKITYPFLTDKCGIKVENNHVKNLYKHLINVEHPTMGFLAVPFQVCPFLLFGLQVDFFLQLLKGKISITKSEMLQDLSEEQARRKNRGFPEHHAHRIGQNQGSYCNDLSATGKIYQVPEVYQSLYRRVTANRNYNDVFRIVNDKEFIEI